MTGTFRPKSPATTRQQIAKNGNKIPHVVDSKRQQFVAENRQQNRQQTATIYKEPLHLVDFKPVIRATICCRNGNSLLATSHTPFRVWFVQASVAGPEGE